MYEKKFTLETMKNPVHIMGNTRETYILNKKLFFLCIMFFQYVEDHGSL